MRVVYKREQTLNVQQTEGRFKGVDSGSNYYSYKLLTSLFFRLEERKPPKYTFRCVLYITHFYYTLITYVDFNYNTFIYAPSSPSEFNHSITTSVAFT